VNTMLDMTNDMAMPMCDTTVAPYARPRSSWLRAVSPMATTGLGLVVTLPSFTGVKTVNQGIETNAKAHGARRPPETPT